MFTAPTGFGIVRSVEISASEKLHFLSIDERFDDYQKKTAFSSLLNLYKIQSKMNLNGINWKEVAVVILYNEQKKEVEIYLNTAEDPKFSKFTDTFIKTNTSSFLSVFIHVGKNFDNSFGDAPSTPIGVNNSDTKSKPAPASEILELNQTLFSPAIGYLEYEGQFLCTAFLVHNTGAVLTSRHALSNRTVSKLVIYFPYNIDGKIPFSFCEILELGENLLESTSSPTHQVILPDYALLKISNPDQKPLPEPLKLANDEITQLPRQYYVLGFKSPDSLSPELVHFANSGEQENLVITYYADTEEGFSGSPFIDVATTCVVGIHCKTTLQPIAENQRTAFAFEYCCANYPSSELSKLVQGIEPGPALQKINQPLPNVTTILTDFLEREEASLRETALGPTPKLGSSHTYRCLLARWLLKGEDKIRFNNNNDGTTITYDNNSNSYKIKNNKYLGKFLTIDEADLQGQAAGKYINSTDIVAIDLINRFFAPQYWKVKIKTSTNGARNKWVKLTAKQSATSNQPAIHMGHKLSANEYWIKGSNDYQEKRLAEKKGSQKYKNKDLTLQTKKTEYIERYEQYETPGHLLYGTSTNEDFMRDPKNYRFEWFSANSSDGPKNKAGNYGDKEPPGLEKVNDHFVPKS